MQSQIYEFSRGELGERVYGDPNRFFNSIKEPIKGLMEKVEGAELIEENLGRGICDEYHASYFISPEGVAISFNAEIAVFVRATGTSKEIINQAKQKIQQAFTKPDKL